MQSASDLPTSAVLPLSVFGFFFILQKMRFQMGFMYNNIHSVWPACVPRLLLCTDHELQITL